ncbi:MAG: MotA/TolQ/ExbB proton channel family protein [Pirellulales bacterium]
MRSIRRPITKIRLWSTLRFRVWAALTIAIWCGQSWLPAQAPAPSFGSLSSGATNTGSSNAGLPTLNLPGTAPASNGSQPNFPSSGINGYQPPPAPQTLEPNARIAAVPGTTGSAGGSTSAASGNVAPSGPAAPGAVAGAATEAGTPNQIPMTSLFGIIREGGILMMPIILCSFTLTVFVFERLIFLRRSRVIPRPFVRGVIEQLEQGQLDREEAMALCEENGSPIAQLFTAALKKWGRAAVEVEQAVLDAGERVTVQLRTHLRLFNAISNITPLLGLLGTVLGMIEAFNTIAKGDAMGRAEMLAGGIGQALLTTAAGLFVAIPAFTAYAYFLGRADKLIIEMDEHAQRVIELISAEGLQESGRSRRSSRARAA